MLQSPESIEAYLHEHIPITRPIGVKVVAFDGEIIRLAAPLQPNLNHRHTVFGGSIATLGILANWTLIHLKLETEDLHPRLVIQKSYVDYIEPIDNDFEAVAQIPDKAIWERFKKMLTQKGKARIAVRSEIQLNQRTVAIHEGAYVALRV